jgi:hypothetical protein
VLKVVIIAITAFIVIGAFISIGKPSAPAPPSNPVDVARYGCEQWTRSHSKLKVSEVLGTYQVQGKTPANHVKVGLDYRAGASGVMMHASCEYLDQGKSMVLLSAKASF